MKNGRIIETGVFAAPKFAGIDMGDRSFALKGAGRLDVHPYPRKRLPYVSRPQLRVVQRVKRGEQLAIATHRNATYTALERKRVLAKVAVNVEGRQLRFWFLTPLGEEVLAAASVPKKSPAPEGRPRVVSAR